jgi:hypothetical protein
VLLTFTADASDASGTPLPAANITWVSNFDGFLGADSTVQHTLTSGGCGIATHHVTATATGSSGKTAMDTVAINVGVIC